MNELAINLEVARICIYLAIVGLGFLLVTSSE